MKLEIPGQIRIFLTITERVGIPTILCLVFGYLYFMKLEKVADELKAIRGEVGVIAERSKNDHEEIKRELRRIGWANGSRGR